MIRLRNKRRSVSSWVSPGPRKPIPPFCLSRWVQPRTRRVAIWRSCASSTCNFPSWVRARWAKISKIRPVRSITRHSHRRSKVTFLRRTQGMIEEHDRSAGRFNGFRNFDCLTFTNKILRVRCFTATGNHLHCFDTGGRGQSFKLHGDLPYLCLAKNRCVPVPPAHRRHNGQTSVNPL